MRQALALALGATCAVAGAAGLSAQDLDVEMLGRIYGTRPPDAYFELRQREPQAFQLQRGLAAGGVLPVATVLSAADVSNQPIAPLSGYSVRVAR